MRLSTLATASAAGRHLATRNTAVPASRSISSASRPPSLPRPSRKSALTATPTATPTAARSVSSTVTAPASHGTTDPIPRAASLLSQLQSRRLSTLGTQSPLLNQANIIPTSSLINVTTLPNKVRVATEATPGHFSAVGVYVDAGSRLERAWVPGESGVSHLLDRMAFKSTTNRSADQMTSEIEALGGNVMCSSSRETIMYQSSVFNKDVPAVLSILADTILNPLLSPQELDIQREAAAYEISEIWNKPEMILPELLHTVAYSGNTLGNPLLCPMESLEVMTADNLRNFMKTWYTSERIVVAGAGMPHEQLVELSQKLFGHIQPSSSASSSTRGTAMRSNSTSSSSSSGSSSSSLFSSPSSPASSASSHGSADFSTAAMQAAQSSPLSGAAGSGLEASNAKAHYSGGELFLPRDDLEFTHVYVAFEGLSIHDDDIYALATLQILLGGGGSFSAGGPGKGMYSRLYTNVLNQHHAVDYCAAFHHCYADSGLFGIAASVHPSFNTSIVHVIARELELLTSGLYHGSVTPAELSRAKNQLKSSLVMALESRLVEVEDLGRQIQAHGKKVSVEEMCERIDRVDLATLHRVATRVLRPQKTKVRLNDGLGSGQATVVAQGQLEGLGNVRQLLAARGLGVPPTA
ncbi:Mitochondrial-processing peptidase subunit alpha [Thecaphora frezii]